MTMRSLNVGWRGWVLLAWAVWATGAHREGKGSRGRGQPVHCNIVFFSVFACLVVFAANW